MKQLLYRCGFRAGEIASAVGDFRSVRPPPPGRILLLTAYTAAIADYGRLASANKAAYAQRHGYAFQERTDGFAPARPPAWSKIPFIREALDSYDWVFWSDADSLIMNGAIRLEEFMLPGMDVVLGEAQTPFRHLNTGSMLFRSSVLARLFLHAVWRLDGFTHDETWEQAAVNYLARRYRFRRVGILPNRRFNSFADVPGDPDPYAPGDFIVHFPGRPDKRTLMARYAPLAR